MQLREASVDDRSAVESVVSAAFNEPADGRVVQLMRALDQTAATRLRWIAEVGGVVAGYVQLSRCWLDTRAALVEVVTLTPLAVAPDLQGQGIGTALLAEALRQADRLGYPAVFLEGDWNYYAPRGFECAEDVGLLSPSDRIPRRAFQVALLSSYTPELTGRFVYAEAVWASDCVGLRDPRLAQVEALARAAARPGG